jgi:trk system potassium uptake protein TrkA
MKEDRKEFVVIGLGRFGGTLCKELSALNIQVMALDKNYDRVQEYSSIVSHAVQIDAIDEESLKSIGIRNFDFVILSFGEDIQSSILATLLLKEMGMKQVWVKARDENHQKVLERVGADRIIHPERDMATRIAHHIVSDKVTDYIELSDKHSIVEIVASDKIAGKTLVELNMHANYNCTIVAIKKSDNNIIISPSPDSKIYKSDILVTIGENTDLTRFENEGV